MFVAESGGWGGEKGGGPHQTSGGKQLMMMLVKGSTCGTDCRGSANNCAQCVRDPRGHQSRCILTGA